MKEEKVISNSSMINGVKSRESDNSAMMKNQIERISQVGSGGDSKSKSASSNSNSKM